MIERSELSNQSDATPNDWTSSNPIHNEGKPNTPAHTFVWDFNCTA
jgi:hypothetical protein